MPGHSGSHVGIIDLELERSTTGSRRWQVQRASVRLGDRRAGKTPVRPALFQALAPDHRAALAWSRRHLGEAAVPLHSYFATVAPSAAQELIAAAKADHVRAALADTSLSDLPLLSSASPFRSGGRGGPANYTDIPAGPLRMRNLSDLYPFPNTVVTLLLTGAEVANWLERSAALFRQVQPGATDAALLDESVPSFMFETIPQLSYAIDLSQPARFDGQGRLVNPDARRITGLRHNGRPVEAGAEFLLVTNNHRAGRARLQDPGSDQQTVFTDGARVQTIIANYVQQKGSVGAPPTRNWHFLPMPGTSVSFPCGPASAQHVSEIAFYRPKVLGRDSDGFTHYRLHL